MTGMRKLSPLQKEPVKRDLQLQHVLLEAGIITETAFKEAAAYQEEHPGVSLDKALIETGALTGREIAGALAMRLQLPFLTLDNISPPMGLLALIPSQMARAHNLLPVLKINKELVVAVADLPESKIVEKLRGLVRMPVHLAVAPAEELAEAVNAAYSFQKNTVSQNRGERKEWVWPEKAPGFSGNQADPAASGNAWESSSRSSDRQGESRERKSAPDFFARSRREAAQENNRFNLFGLGAEKRGGGNAKRGTGFEGLLAGASDSSPSKSGRQNTEGKEMGAFAAPSGNSGGIEHFEKGLAALQHGAYEEALREFEAALEQDAANRVCKANIRRIKKILSEKNG